MSAAEPSEEEMRAMMEEQLATLRVDDVVIQSVITLVNLGGRRLGLAGAPGERDLEQARLAIDAVRALAPLLAPEDSEPIRGALTQLQMAYAREAGAAQAPMPPPPAPGAGSAPPPGASPAPPPSGRAEADRRALEEAERAKARSRIWTPPGT